MIRRRAAVLEFYRAFGHPIADRPSLAKFRPLQRASWLLEEALEFVHAAGCEFVGVDPNGKPMLRVVREPDWIAMLDAMADVDYINEGSAIEMGLPINPVFTVVHLSNMDKLGPDGKPITRASDGKTLKRPGWEPPDLGRVLAELIAIDADPNIPGVGICEWCEGAGFRVVTGSVCSGCDGRGERSR